MVKPSTSITHVPQMVGHVKLTADAQKSFDFSIECYQLGLCSATELKYALDAIHKEDLSRQMAKLIEQGFTSTGAWKHVYNLDKGMEIT